MRRVAITGLGAVSPLGLDVPSAWDAAVSGRTRESAERFVAAASAMAGMGANWVILSLPHTGLEDYQDTMRWAAEAILPQLVDL